jgi:hypothetical protein
VKAGMPSSPGGFDINRTTKNCLQNLRIVITLHSDISSKSLKYDKKKREDIERRTL